ncbi:MAG: GxxExxY protein [Opitutus sp.]|nr:GxxExxY protein [Opitutus sp.]
MPPKSLNDLSHELIGAAIEVHRELGPGLLESAYHGAYSRELTLRHIAHVSQKLMPVLSKGVTIETRYRLDILAEDRVVVELKAVEKLLPIHSAQLLTYLRLDRFPLGLLLNFYVRKLTDGLERISNDAPNLSALSASSAFQNPSS